MIDQVFKAERVNISGRPEFSGCQLGQVGHRCHLCFQESYKFRELFIKIVLGIRTENKNGSKYPWRDGAEKCSCTGTILNIGLILETGAYILGSSLFSIPYPFSTSCPTRAYAPHGINTDADTHATIPSIDIQ